MNITLIPLLSSSAEQCRWTTLNHCQYQLVLMHWDKQVRMQSKLLHQGDLGSISNCFVSIAKTPNSVHLYPTGHVPFRYSHNLTLVLFSDTMADLCICNNSTDFSNISHQHATMYSVASHTIPGVPSLPSGDATKISARQAHTCQAFNKGDQGCNQCNP